jgi:hypothetical protein
LISHDVKERLWYWLLIQECYSWTEGQLSFQCPRETSYQFPESISQFGVFWEWHAIVVCTERGS